jgi:hypothetical protein
MGFVEPIIIINRGTTVLHQSAIVYILLLKLQELQKKLFQNSLLLKLLPPSDMDSTKFNNDPSTAFPTIF